MKGLVRREPIIDTLKSFDQDQTSGQYYTSAMSILMPLGRFLYVGGNKYNNAKLIVWALPQALSRVTKNWLPTEPWEELGLNVTLTCFQDVCEPCTETELDATVSPAAFLSPRVN